MIDPWDHLIEAGIDNRRRERGSKLNRLAHISLARRLSEFVDLTNATVEHLEDFSRAICGYGPPDALRLYNLHTVAQQILDRCEAERARAIDADLPYEYPAWSTALAWFNPEEDEAAILRQRVAELEADIENLEDQIANPVPQEGSKRWFERELLAMAWGIFRALSITVTNEQTLVQGMSDDRRVCLRVAIARVFPGMSSTAWINMKHDHFDKAPLHAVGAQPTIASIPWDRSLDVSEVPAVRAQATEKSVSASALGLDADPPKFYPVAALKRLLRKKPTILWICGRGVVGAEVVRNDITYEYFVRAAAQ